MDDYLLTKRGRLYGALYSACCLVAIFGLALPSVPTRFLHIHLLFAALLIYSAFSKRKLFSFLDLIGWLSAPPAISTEIPPKVIVLPHEGKRPSPRKRKLGIVLAGGGGKGAYQVGCWRALETYGIKFHAVAGTSAGALNAALMARGDVSKAEQIWGNLSASQLLTLSPVAAVFSAIMLRRYKRKYVGDRPISNVLVIGLPASFSALLFWFIYELINFGLFLVNTEPAPVLAWIALALMATYTIIVSVYLTILVLCLVPKRQLLPLAASIFQNKRLHDLIASIAPAGTFVRSPLECYATVAQETLVYDPSDPGHDRGEVYATRTGRRLEPRIIFRPIYLPLAKLEAGPDGMAHRMLALSGTLPIIFQAIKMGPHWYYDGGLADNIPIRPLLDQGCDQIFVLHLDNSGQDELDGKTFDVLTSDGLKAKLKWGDRLCRLSDTYSSKLDLLVQQTGLSGMASAFKEDLGLHGSSEMRIASEIVHIVPSHPLGSFVTGTLNFTGRKARWLMQLGEQDMITALRQIGAIQS